MPLMKLHEMRTACRKCGRELRADEMDDTFVTFYCAKCGIYTSRPVEEFQVVEAPTAAAAAAEEKPGSS